MGAMRRLLAMALLPLLLVAGCSDPGSALDRAESLSLIHI